MTTTPTVRQFAVKLHHDKGHTVFTTAASSAASAVEIILNAERAPRGSIRWVREQPTCNYCGQPATRYHKDSGDPLCRDCATSQHKGLAGGMSAYTRKLGSSRWTTLAPHQYQPEVPDPYPVTVLTTPEQLASAKDLMTCATCLRSWDDAVCTSMTPVPAARCPFEYYH